MHSLRTRRKRAQRATSVLEACYGSPRLNNKEDPLDELFFIVLSQMTTGPSYERVFNNLKRSIAWEQLPETAVAHLSGLISQAGLAGQKAPRIREIAIRLRKDFGHVSLQALADLHDDAAFEYLTSLPGVGEKTAKCVMMYSLGRKVLPVDTHTARLAFRLELVSRPVADAIVNREIEAVVAPTFRYGFHVNAVAHGRAVCRSRHPHCPDCPIASLCSRGRTRQSGSAQKTLND